MNLVAFLKEWEFEESTYYKVIDGKIYRNVQAGLIECKDMRTTRKVGPYRIIAQHFECALPYTNYYLVFEDNIYKATLHPQWVPDALNTMVAQLKEII